MKHILIVEDELDIQELLDGLITADQAMRLSRLNETA